MNRYLIYTACVAAWLLMMTPAVLYLFTGWVTRIDGIRSLLTRKHLETYFRLYRPSALENHHDMDYEKLRDDCITAACGRKHYILPLVLLAVVTAIGMWLTGHAVIAWTTPS